MKNSKQIKTSPTSKMSRLVGNFTFIALFLFFLGSCKKETIEPDVPAGNGSGNGGGGNGGGGNVTQVDVNGLKQNYINAEGVNKVQLTRTLVESYDSGADTYTKMTYQGKGNTTITLMVKGSEMQEGNFSIKKFRLGSNPTETEAVVYLAINSTLLDFEVSSTDRLSIAKNAEGFFVIKMGPTVGIKRNSWDPELTAPISFHIVNNPTKIVISDSEDGVSTSTLYEYNTENHWKSNQPFAAISFAQNTPGKPVSIKFIDYDFTTGTIAKSNYTISQSAVSNSDNYNGTAPKGVHLSYGFGAYNQDYSLSQTLEMELTEGYIILKYTDLKMVHKTDPSKTLTITGEIMIAR